MAKKTIYLTESNHTRLREALIERLQSHDESLNIGKSDKLGYEKLAEFIQKSLTEVLEAPEYARFKSLEHYVTYHSLWTIIYQTKKRPSVRKRMNRTAIELLCLFAFGEIREDMLEEEGNIPIDQKPSRRDMYEIVAGLGFFYIEDFSFRRLQQSINKAKVEIKILDTFMDNWGRLRTYLKSATERDCRVRLILSDAYLEPIVARSITISTFGGSKESLLASITSIKEEISTWERKDLVELRTHDCLPGFNLFGIDGTYFIGLFWHTKEAVEGPFMRVKNDSFKEYVDEHFESLWNHAKNRSPILVAKPIEELIFKLKTYLGDWYLYCNKVKKDEESFKLRSMEHGKVVENLVQISDEGEGELAVVFVSSSKEIFRGKGYLNRKNESFLEFRLKSDKNKGTLHFNFHVGKGLDNHLIGIYNHMYVKPPVLGTGLTCLVKISSKMARPIQPETWKPRDVQNIAERETQTIIRYLTFPSGTRLEAIQSFERLQTFKRFNLPSLFKGVYKIYAYQGSETKSYSKFITESLLKIDDKHQVFHKRNGPQNKIRDSFLRSEGKVEASNEDSLIIRLKSRENRRMGFFVINIGDYNPREKTYYTGVFTGIGLRSKRVAIGTRVILEYLGDDYQIFENEQIDRYSIFSDEYLELPKEVRQNLTGRVNNMIGFLKTKGASSQKALNHEADNGIDMKQVFFDSACQRALTDKVNQVPIAAKMFERAILHGFQPFEAFEEKLEEYESNGLISTRIKKAILTNKLYLDLSKAIT